MSGEKLSANRDDDSDGYMIIRQIKSRKEEKTEKNYKKEEKDDEHRRKKINKSMECEERNRIVIQR